MWFPMIASEAITAVGCRPVSGSRVCSNRAARAKASRGCAAMSSGLSALAGARFGATITAAACDARPADKAAASSAKTIDSGVAVGMAATPRISESISAGRSSAPSACANSDNFIGNKGTADDARRSKRFICRGPQRTRASTAARAYSRNPGELRDEPERPPHKRRPCSSHR